MRVSKVERIDPDSLRIHFADGQVREIQLWRYARKGTVFADLADPAFSLRCRIVDKGHGLRWPSGLDMSAEALMKMGKALEEAAPTASKEQRLHSSAPSRLT